MSTSTRTSTVQHPAHAAFADVLCAVDGSRGSSEGVRQAIELARPDGQVTFVCVTDVRGVGANRIAGVGEHRCGMALNGARALAHDRGVRSDTELVHGPSAVDEILARQGAHDILVAGSHPESRAGGIMVGSTSTALVHRTAGPLLVAKPPAPSDPFLQRIVVATDGSRDDDPAVAMAIRLARTRGSEIGVVSAMRGAGRGALGVIGAQIWEATGTEPVMTAEPGEPAELIARIAAASEASLVVVGHHGRHGIKALASVSEQVVHRAGCSVLVVPFA